MTNDKGHPDDDDDGDGDRSHGTHHDAHGGEGEVSIYISPMQRQRWGDEQVLPHTNWGDTFFDLFYVAAAYNLGTLLREEPTARGILYFVGMFWPIMNIWILKMYNDSRFETGDDVFHRVYEQGSLIAVATAVLHIRPVSILSKPEENVDMFVFCLSITIAKILGLGRLAEIVIAGYRQRRQEEANETKTEDDVSRKASPHRRNLLQNLQLPNAVRAARFDIVWILSAVVFYIAATITAGTKFYNGSSSNDAGDYGSSYAAGKDDNYTNVEPSDKNYTDDDRHLRMLASSSEYEADDYSMAENVFHVPIWLCIGGASLGWALCQILFVYCIPSGDEFVRWTVPMNIVFSIHRYGEWTMLMLGESILSLLIVDVTEQDQYYKTLFNGILSVTLLQYLHFRSQPHSADDHALRRSRASGFAFTLLKQAYSAALIVLGTSYKMLLYEYIYSAEAEQDDYHRRRRTTSMLSRYLAGSSESGALRFDPDDRRQRVAHFFCISMALVWLCSDLMILVHRGVKCHMDQNRCQVSGVIKVQCMLMFVARVALIVLMGTLSLYVTAPELISFVGLAGIVSQVVLRFVGSSMYGAKCQQDCPGGEHHDEEDEDVRQWPNVTEPQIEKDDEREKEERNLVQ